jgi:hypothetical protein
VRRPSQSPWRRRTMFVTEPHAAMDDPTLKLGLLMESAHAHQKAAEAHWDGLREHTRGLDQIVREEIRRTLVEELKDLTEHTARATLSLRGLHRAAQLRGILWSAGIALTCSAIGVLVTMRVLPSEHEVAALTVRRDQLEDRINRLAQQGGRVDWRRCGESLRLCVRVDRGAPAFGDKGDYLLVKED